MGDGRLADAAQELAREKRRFPPAQKPVMAVAKGGAASRIINCQKGMSFMIDNTTQVPGGRLMLHVRDYRYSQGGRPYQIWTVPADDCEIISTGEWV